MLRILIQYVLPLVLPFLIYLAYVSLTRDLDSDWLAGLPWITLSVTGLVLTAISLVVWTLLSGAPPEEVYIPPHVEDGRIVPGRTEAQ